MKIPAIFLMVAMLAGCASTPQGLRVTDLRDQRYFRGDYTIPLSFAKIQAALFKHEAACGSAPVFALDPRQTSYATITDKPAGQTSYENAIVADLTFYQSTLMSEPRSRAHVYSYYADSATQQRIEQLFAAIAHPEVCP
ncbi:hypothetical protein H0A64_07975 [Alcaligenaceae bacterium]|nr:hypothetical protein [Alcaligenaceae bacterium]